MENEFILTAMFAIVWVILSVTILATAVYGMIKGFESSQEWSKVQNMLFLIHFLWLLYGVAMIVAFGTEMIIKMM